MAQHWLGGLPHLNSVCLTYYSTCCFERKRVLVDKVRVSMLYCHHVNGWHTSNVPQIPAASTEVTHRPNSVWKYETRVILGGKIG
jgi:hypothetical protein